MSDWLLRRGRLLIWSRKRCSLWTLLVQRSLVSLHNRLNIHWVLLDVTTTFYKSKVFVCTSVCMCELICQQNRPQLCAFITLSLSVCVCVCAQMLMDRSATMNSITWDRGEEVKGYFNTTVFAPPKSFPTHATTKDDDKYPGPFVNLSGFWCLWKHLPPTVYTL